MDTVTILRDLWRHRFVVIGVYLVALLAGTAVLYKISFPPKLESRKYQVGVASTRILVDTPSSQVVEIAPKGSDSLGVRANLLASLMVDGVVKTAIAKRAGLRPDDLVGIALSDTDPSAATVTPPHDPRASVLTTHVVTDNDGAQLPIIEIEAQAPDATAAAALANAAIVGLRDYLDSKAAVQRIPDAQRLQVSGLGAPQARMAARGPKDVFAIAAVIFVFGSGCACILLVLALVRSWRAASAQEAASGDALLDEEAPSQPVAAANGHAPADVSEDWGGENWLTAARPALVAARPADDDAAAADDDDAEHADQPAAVHPAVDADHADERHAAGRPAGAAVDAAIDHTEASS
jgi:hypothetical protein